jgi:hypothetical protein
LLLPTSAQQTIGAILMLGKSGCHPRVTFGFRVNLKLTKWSVFSAGLKRTTVQFLNVTSRMSYTAVEIAEYSRKIGRSRSTLFKWISEGCDLRDPKSVTEWVTRNTIRETLLAEKLLPILPGEYGPTEPYLLQSPVTEGFFILSLSWPRGSCIAPIETGGAAWPGMPTGTDPVVFHFQSSLVQALKRECC